MEITEGLGVVIEENMAKVGNSSLEQRREAILRLLDANLKLNTQARFSIGDLYNSLPDTYGSRLKFVQDNFPAKAVDRVYKNLRQYGWVASKWPPRERLKDLPWRHFVERFPNQKKDEEEVKQERWKEFLHPDLLICGLCGNSGYVDTRNRVKSPMGADCGIKTYCICPNGRSIKKQIEKATSKSKFSIGLIHRRESVTW
jgi:hypothetical protein